MDKQFLLEEIRAHIHAGDLTKNEVLTLFENGGEVRRGWEHLSLTRVLYYLGGFIVLLGIGVFVAQFWDELGPLGRIAVSLGSAVVGYGLGTYLLSRPDTDEMGLAFHVIGAALFPFGMVTAIAELAPSPDFTWWVWVGIFGVLTVLYVVTHAYVRKHAIFVFLQVVFGTALAYSLLFALTENMLAFNDIYAYFTIMIGLSYFMLARYYENSFGPLQNYLHLAGSFAVLTPPFSLFDTPMWEVLYVFVVSGMVAASLYLKSRIVLVVATLHLMGYVIYLTAEYFADVAGWPLALVVMGLLLIALGYGSVRLNKTLIRGTGAPLS